MPVRKFRSLEEWQESKQAFWTACDDPHLPDRIRQHWRRWAALVPFPNPRGLRKYRSLEEADADRDRWESERIESIRAQRVRKR
jgi:hypothetical protein